MQYRYDEWGNVIEKTERQPSVNAQSAQEPKHTYYEYDCQNRLIRLTNADGVIAHYIYDIYGRRVHKKVIKTTDELGVMV